MLSKILLSTIRGNESSMKAMIFDGSFFSFFKGIL